MAKLSGLRLEWLESFLAVADYGSFSRAARTLHVSQPAVSTHVKALEGGLGASLVQKLGGRVRLTPSGEAVAAEAREVLEGVSRLRESASRSESEVRGSLAVGASTTPGNYILPALLGRFERRHPEVRTRLVIGNSANVLERLSRSEVDLAAVGIEPTASAFLSEPLGSDEIVAFVHAGHPLARGKGPVTPAACARHRFLMREADSATRRLSDGWFALHKVRPAVMELGCPETLKRAVAAGLGVGILSRYAVTAAAGEREFRILDVPGFPIRRKLYVAVLKRRKPNRTLTSFLELLRASASAR